MSLTPSNMLALGTKAPNFTLYDTVSGKHLSLDLLKSEVATVIMFICNHCPFVKHVNSGLIQLAHDYEPQGIRFIAISSNDPTTHPEDGPDAMKIAAQTLGYPFPYLFDETQDVAQAYRAACTPDFYVFDKQLSCVYRGQLDDSRPDNGIPVTGADLRKALDHILRGEAVLPIQKPNIGCNIKWKEAHV